MQPSWTSESVDELAGQYPHRTVRLAMISFIALQCLDLLTTLAAFAHGGVELNPIVRSMMPWAGRGLAVLASKLILISLILSLGRRKRILYIANVLYTAIVVWNLTVVFAKTT